MRFAPLWLSLAIALTLGFAAPPETRAATELPYADAAKLALEGNPELLAIRMQQEGFSQRANQALSPNNPVVAINKNDIPGISIGAQSGSTVYSVSMTVGFPGKAVAQSTSLRHQSEAAREQALAREVDILAALSNIYASLITNAQVRDFLKEEVQKAGDLVKLLERKYATAQTSQVDLLNAKVELASLQHDALLNHEDKLLLLSQFRSAIRHPGDESFLPLLPQEIEIPSLSKTLPELRELMLRNRHQLKAAEKQLDSARSALLGASLAALPDFQLSGAMNIYNIASAQPINGVTRDYSLGIGIAIPIFFPLNERAGIEAASSDRAAAEYQQEAQALSSISDLESLFSRYGSVEKELENLKELVLPATRASYDLTLRTYTLGKADYLRLHEARKGWIQARTDYLQKKLLEAQLYVQLVQQVGCDFSTEKVFHACI